MGSQGWTYNAASPVSISERIWEGGWSGWRRLGSYLLQDETKGNPLVSELFQISQGSSAGRI